MLSKPGPILDTFTTKFLLGIWMRTLEEVGEQVFDQGLLQAIEKSTFRVDIAEIRKGCGLDNAIVDPSEQEAKAALRPVIEALRLHGFWLKPIHGKVLSDRDSDGRALPRSDWTWEPDTPSPTFDEVTEAALRGLGYGSRQPGLEVVNRHPAVSAPAESDTGSFRQRLAKDVESAWLAAYREARASSARTK